MWRLSFALSALIALNAAANPIPAENAKPGSAGWKLANGRSTDIEGYASLTSVNVGDSIDIFVNTASATYTIDFYRMGWYNGVGARQVATSGSLAGHQQVVPAPDASTGLIECDWTNPYTLKIPADWVSGVYVGKLTALPGGQNNWLMFVVKDEARFSDLLFQSSVTTMNAYNGWGTKSLYPFNSTGPQAVKVSFDRPYGAGAGVTEFIRWEYPTIRFLEKEGYDVSYSTSIDTHANGDMMLRHRAWLSVGHDEYWSFQMRQNVLRARDAGVNLGFLSSNTSYWQIRFEADARGVPNRRIIAYKESALSADPLASDGDPTNDFLVTTAWRNPPVNMPEEEMKGSMFTFTTQPISADIVIGDVSNWVFANSGLHPGDHLSNLVGYEVDKMFSQSPPGTTQLTHSPFNNNGVTDYSDMTIYQAASGAWVFATGTMEWAYGLDDPALNNREVAAPPGGWVQPGVQQITRNVLAAFLAEEPARKGRTRIVPRR